MMSSAHLAGTTPQPSWPAALRLARRAGWLGIGLGALAIGGLAAASHGPWTLAALIALVIAPDLTFLVGMGQARQMAPGQLPPAAVPWYNAAHRPWLPALLLVVCAAISLSGAWWGPLTPLFAGGLGWLAHIAIDRAVGYGLRSPAGFQRHAHSHR
jgi:membrane-bound metal-dependent hydrolase YbcI (DUF457 family)